VVTGVRCAVLLCARCVVFVGGASSATVGEVCDWILSYHTRVLYGSLGAAKQN
jgi:hypothetical protein